ncbi:serine/threonine protein kinase [Sphaeroforma arctica JP610]|uniref:Serine/threonine protein kinase n=1 Tax=Sphaeroforma arctica JP610 TaxID=667725 RepID=A0A0L0FQT5_9EUKA|nr:serine/threonine protein kinase [Sphaeroforma arctica JP610]KNC78911.1 serine/threonine protein kinase [Sphaeroforma arctica JP610]|eukprot:XP_014152813.1 serine/threonine protein kinase [Sphaeroforma arctica JP610]
MSAAAFGTGFVSESKPAAAFGTGSAYESRPAAAFGTGFASESKPAAAFGTKFSSASKPGSLFDGIFSSEMKPASFPSASTSASTIGSKSCTPPFGVPPPFGVASGIMPSTPASEVSSKKMPFAATSRSVHSDPAASNPECAIDSAGVESQSLSGDTFSSNSMNSESGTQPLLASVLDAKPIDMLTAELEAESDVYFKPVVHLEEVEVKTGEDEEDVLFEMRAKLYRYADDQWKERGVGPVKLLKHRQSGVVRFLLRRDTTFKVAANHRITSNMQLNPDTNVRIFSWVAPSDFVDGVSRRQMFKVRFIDDETAEIFKILFEHSVRAAKVIKDTAKAQKDSAEPGSEALNQSTDTPWYGSIQCTGAPDEHIDISSWKFTSNTDTASNQDKASEAKAPFVFKSDAKTTASPADNVPNLSLGTSADGGNMNLHTKAFTFTQPRDFSSTVKAKATTTPSARSPGRASGQSSFAKAKKLNNGGKETHGKFNIFSLPQLVEEMHISSAASQDLVASVQAKLNMQRLREYERDSTVLFSGEATLEMLGPVIEGWKTFGSGIVQILEHVKNGVAHLVFYRGARVAFGSTEDSVSNSPLVFQQINTDLQLQPLHVKDDKHAVAWGKEWSDVFGDTCKVRLDNERALKCFERLIDVLRKNPLLNHDSVQHATVDSGAEINSKDVSVECKTVSPANQVFRCQRREHTMQLIAYSSRETFCTSRYAHSSITDIPLQSVQLVTSTDSGEMWAKLRETSTLFAKIATTRPLFLSQVANACAVFKSTLRRCMACMQRALDMYQSSFDVMHEKTPIAVEKALSFKADFEAKQIAISQLAEVPVAMVTERDILRTNCVASVRDALVCVSAARDMYAGYAALHEDLLVCRAWLDKWTSQTSGESLWWGAAPGASQAEKGNVFASHIREEGVEDGDATTSRSNLSGQHVTNELGHLGPTFECGNESTTSALDKDDDTLDHVTAQSVRRDTTESMSVTDEGVAQTDSKSTGYSCESHDKPMDGTGSRTNAGVQTEAREDACAAASDLSEAYKSAGDLSMVEEVAIGQSKANDLVGDQSEPAEAAGEQSELDKSESVCSEASDLADTQGDGTSSAKEGADIPNGDISAAITSTDGQLHGAESAHGNLKADGISSNQSKAEKIPRNQTRRFDATRLDGMSTKCATVLACAEDWLSRTEYEILQASTDSAMERLRTFVAPLLFDSDNDADRQAHITSLEQTYRCVVDEHMYITNPDSILHLAPLLGVKNALVPLQYFVSAGSAQSLQLDKQIDQLETILAKYVQGLEQPDLHTIRKYRKSFRTLEKQRKQMQYEIDMLDSDQEDDGFASDAKATINAKRQELQAWDIAQRTYRAGLIEGLCRHRTEALRQAEAHYPELLNSKEFRQALGLDEHEKVCAQMGLLWEKSSLSDYTPVTDFSSEIAKTGGRTVQRMTGPRGEDVVIKSFALGDRSMRKQFFRQCEYLATLSDVNLVKVLGVFVEKSYGRVVMPYYSGKSLEVWLDTHKPTARTVEECQRLAREVLTGVASLHVRGFVHCDIKPGNVLLTQTNRCVLSDFDGVLKVDEQRASSGGGGLTKSFMGTMGYLAPELKGDSAVPFDHRTDAYAVGKVVTKLFDDVSIQDAELFVHRDDFISRMTHADRESRMTVTEAIDHPFLGLPSEQTCQCVVCNDVFRETDGIRCSKGHFNHSQCIEGWLIAQAGAENHAQMRKTGGQLPCMGRYGQLACDELFPVSAFVKNVSADAFKAYEGVVKSITESCMQEDFNIELQRVKEDLENQFAVQGELERQVRYIADDILTIKCPRQGHAFIDFTGCFALKCHACDCHFCAYCLQDCGRDAHAHVRQCAMKPPGADEYYGQLSTFNKQMRDRRRKLLKAHWQTLTLNASDKVKLAEKIQPLLDALDPPHGSLSHIV